MGRETTAGTGSYYSAAPELASLVGKIWRGRCGMINPSARFLLQGHLVKSVSDA